MTRAPAAQQQEEVQVQEQERPRGLPLISPGQVQALRRVVELAPRELGRGLTLEEVERLAWDLERQAREQERQALEQGRVRLQQQVALVLGRGPPLPLPSGMPITGARPGPVRMIRKKRGPSGART